MTRKQAVFKAIEALEALDGKDRYIEEAKSILIKMTNEFPVTGWTKEWIFDMLDQFVIDNRRNPTTTDLKKSNKLPAHPVIKYHFDMGAKDFLQKYYPKEYKCNSQFYGFRTKEEWLKLFINEYNRICPTSAEEYNHLREKNTPSWGSIAGYYHITKWSEFLKFAGLKTYRKINNSRRALEKVEFIINSSSELEEEYYDICDELERKMVMYGG